MGPMPEIRKSELDAARRFLTSFRDDERAARAPHALRASGITAGSGIPRARRLRDGSGQRARLVAAG